MNVILHVILHDFSLHEFYMNLRYFTRLR